MKQDGLHILLVSVHGLIRGTAPELGRDPDTGGQVLYVLELARALAEHPEVAQVDLLTRLVEDSAVSSDYARVEEPLTPHARIIRIPFGPRRYIRKELLWDHLDHLVDGYLAFARKLPRMPDLIHSHYGDAGYVAMRLANLLGIPFVHSGHSLGRCKKASLVQAGGKETSLERTFHFTRRIQVEEDVLAQASMVVASTRQEIVEQYGLYSNFDSRRAAVIPPGTDTSRFSPPGRTAAPEGVAASVDRFLREPKKPLLLCIGRPVPRKNLLGLVQAFGEDPDLRNQANLAIVAGSRMDYRNLEEACRNTWEELLHAIDRHDLYGHIAIPKSHQSDDIPEFYRLAAQRKGLCVNPALSETFGLTLIEAAASGLPLVATDNGGPKDIVANCRNGVLVDVTQPNALASVIKEALSDPKRWGDWSRNGIRRVKDFYTWEAHVNRYLKVVRKILRKGRNQSRRAVRATRSHGTPPFLIADHALVLDLDRTLIGDRNALRPLLGWIRENRHRLVFGIATGRRLESALWVLRDWGLDSPDVLISSVGSEIHYGPDWRPDQGWENHIRHGWRREDVALVLKTIPGLRAQAQGKLGPYKVSYHVNPRKIPELGEIRTVLSNQGLRARLVYSQSRYLDVLPQRASKGHALRYLAFKWGLSLDRFIVAGDSGSDLEMLTGATLGIVVGNHSSELAPLRGRNGIHFVKQNFAAGVMEGLEWYGIASPMALGGASPWGLVHQPDDSLLDSKGNPIR